MGVYSMIGRALSTVPRAVAVGVVDMASGLLLGVLTVGTFRQHTLDLVAGATKEIFEGENILRIEEAFNLDRGTENTARYIQAVVLFSTNLVHVCVRMKSNQANVLVVVCRADTNVGLALTHTRAIADAG